MRGLDTIGIDQILAARDRPPRPPIAFLRVSLRDMRLTSFPLLTARHPYKWITVDPAVGGRYVITLGSPASANSPALFTIQPGIWAPIDDRPVWVLAQAEYGTIPADLTGQTVFWLCAEQPPANAAPSSRALQSVSDVVPAAATAPTLSTQGNPIPLGYNHLTLHVHDDASATRIVGAETNDIEVWWFDSANGIWMHNGSDDFDAAGRGAAIADHDVEIYYVPYFASRVYLNRSAGATVLWVDELWSFDIGGG